MRAFTLLLAVLGGPLVAQTPVQAELRRAWQADAAAVVADLAEQEAELVLQAAQRSWLPVVSFDSPSLLSASGNDQSSSLSGTASVTVTQKLPGGGALSAGVSDTVTQVLTVPSGQPPEATQVPSLTLGLTLPLGRASLDPDDDRLLASLEHQVTLRDLWITTVKRAAALDLARSAWTTQQSLLAAAEAKAALASTWEAQGRATKTEAWKAARDADAARWQVERAALEVSALEQAWSRRSGAPAGRWSAVQLKAWAAEAWSDLPALEDQIAEVKQRQRVRGALVDQAAWAPVVSASTTVRKPDQSWEFSGQVGLRWSTDALVQAPLAARRYESSQKRQEVLDQEASALRREAEDERRARAQRIEGYLPRLEAEVERQSLVVREAQGLVAQGRLTEADRAEVEAGLAQLVAEHRRLLWEHILVRWE